MKVSPNSAATCSSNKLLAHVESDMKSVSKSNGRQQTVCILDDDASVVKATSRLLSSAGWMVDSFTDPIEFLDHARTCQPRVVVLDILMPKMSGLEVQKRLRSISPQSRVIVLTSNDDPKVRDEAMHTGAAAFFIKPVDDDQFIAGIEAAFSRN